MTIASRDTLLPDADEVAAWLKGAVERGGEVGRPDSAEEIRARLPAGS